MTILEFGWNDSNQNGFMDEEDQYYVAHRKKKEDWTRESREHNSWVSRSIFSVRKETSNDCIVEYVHQNGVTVKEPPPLPEDPGNLEFDNDLDYQQALEQYNEILKKHQEYYIFTCDS